jgi:hypothetical protein
LFGNLLAANSLDLPFTKFKFQPQRRSGFVDFWRDQPFLSFVQLREDPRWNDRNIFLGDPGGDLLGTGWSYKSAQTYRLNSYYEPAVVLRSLPALLGEDGEARLLRGMRRYADAARFRHATTQDFVREFCAGAEANLDWYFAETLGGTATVDWKIEVGQQRAKPLFGFVQHAPGTGFDHVAPPVLEPGGEWQLEILVSREGELCLPVDVRWSFEDGTSETVRWTREEQQRSRWLRYKRSSKVRCISAAIDPERGYFLDRNLSDNQWFEQKDIVAPWRWSERAFSRAAHWLVFQGGLGG